MLAPTLPLLLQVLPSAHYISHHAHHITLSQTAISSAAQNIYTQMQHSNYTTQTWSSHHLHPQGKNKETVDFIFTMDILNFSFWSTKNETERFQIEYGGKKWTGYWSLVAALKRAVEEGRN